MTAQTEMKTLDDIRHMCLPELKEELDRLAAGYPKQCQQGVMDGTEILETRNTIMYDALVRGQNPTIIEGIRVNYACILKAIGQLELLPKKKPKGTY